MNKTDIWAFRYEPTSFEEMILNENVRNLLKPTFQTLPNLFLTGRAGLGKGTFVNIFRKETGLDFLHINASLYNKIEDFETKIIPFATSSGFGGLKYVICNEAEWFVRSKTADAFLDFMDKIQKVTRFIFIVNRKDGFKEEHLSRFQKVDYIPAPATDYYKYALSILKKEDITPIKENIFKIVKKCYPDFRNLLNTLQQNCYDGKMLDTIQFSSDSFEGIFQFIKNKDIDSIREILRNNAIDYISLYEFLFENINEFKSPGDVIIEISDRMFKHTTHPNSEINFLSGIVSMIKNGII